MEDWSAAQIAEALHEIKALAERDDQPLWVRRMARAGLERLMDIERAVGAGDRERAEAIQASMNNLIPLGLRGVDALNATSRFIDVDDTATPPTVTVHWERVSRGLRKQTASLASAYVDFFAPPDPGGRPRK
jgi:hypothetical protein